MDRIQLRRDTSARWAEINPILLEGEVGYEIDTKLRKIGDGVNRWNDLEYLRAEGIVQEKGNSENVVMSQAAVSRELSGLGSEVKELEVDTIGTEIVKEFSYAFELIPIGFTIKAGSVVKNIGNIDVSLYDTESLDGKNTTIPVGSEDVVLTFDVVAVRARYEYGECRIVVRSLIYKLQEDVSNNTSEVSMLKSDILGKEFRFSFLRAWQKIPLGVTLKNGTIVGNTGNVEMMLVNADGSRTVNLFVGGEYITLPFDATSVSTRHEYGEGSLAIKGLIDKLQERIDDTEKKILENADNIGELYSELETKAEKKTFNLFDKKREQINGKFIGSDGKLSAADNCIASYLIPIKPNTLYSWNAIGANTNYSRFVKLDGVSGLNLLNEAGDKLPFTSRNYGVIKSPSDAAYFQFTISYLGRLDIADSACLIESDTFIDKYYEYGMYIDENELPKEYRDLPQRVSALEKGGSDNPLFGKNIYFCGDSIMNGLLVDADRRLYNQIADKYGMIANNKSLDGAVFFYPMNNNRESIYWQLSQIPSDADYIIIQGGVNGINMTNPDSTPYFPMGEMTDSYTSDFDLSTQIGCVEGICKYLFENFSGKKFGFIITYQISSRYDSYLNYWAKKADAFVKVLEKWGIPYIDWRQSGVNLAANAQNYGFSVFDYEEFSESKDYNLDDKVRYDNIGYKAKVAIKAGKPFDVTQWQQLSTKAEDHDTWHCNALAYDLLSYQTGKWIETL